MKIYVAGKAVERARNVMALLRAQGHTITYDWIDTLSEGSTKEIAIKEADAVRACDFLVYLWEPDQESARYEAGMAMGLEKPVVVSGNTGAFFFKLDNVYCVESDAEIGTKVEELALHISVLSTGA